MSPFFGLPHSFNESGDGVGIFTLWPSSDALGSTNIRAFLYLYAYQALLVGLYHGWFVRIVQ